MRRPRPRRARPLTGVDLESAARVLGDGFAEMPVYRYLLGDHVDRVTVRIGLARVLLRRLLDGGYVAGVHDDARLIGLVAWFRDGDEQLLPSAAVDPADVEFLLAYPDVARRLLELAQAPLPVPEPRAVTLSHIVVVPDRRHAGIVPVLADVVIEVAVAAETFFYAWTGSVELRERFCRGWNLTPFAEHRLPDGTVLYGIRSERLPAAVHSTARPIR